MRTKSLRIKWPLIVLKMDISVSSANEMIACCHRFLVIIEHRKIVPNLVNVDRMMCSDVDIGISVTLIAKSGLNLKGVDYSRGFNFRSTISGNLAQSAFSAFTLVENPNLTIFSVLFAASCFTDEPMKEGKSTPLNISQARLIFSLFGLSGRKVSAAQ